jgi:hypothetical protein
MPERVTTSFIPKASLEVERTREAKTRPVALVNIVAIILLALAVVASIGVFLFEQYTIQSIASKQQSLERSRAAFEPATIKELSRLDSRIDSGMTLLGTHPALSLLFNDLEARTLASVRFSDFKYEIAGPSRVVLTMKGQAASFNAVALQSDAFSKSDIITEPIFSNVNINSSGSIDFDFSGIIDSSRMKYTGANATPPVTPTTATTTTPAPQTTP